MACQRNGLLYNRIGLSNVHKRQLRGSIGKFFDFSLYHDARSQPLRKHAQLLVTSANESSRIRCMVEFERFDWWVQVLLVLSNMDCLLAQACKLPLA